MKTAVDICSVLLKCEGPTAFKLASGAAGTESERRDGFGPLAFVLSRARRGEAVKTRLKAKQAPVSPDE